jgi:hypothetical protein
MSRFGDLSKKWTPHVRLYGRHPKKKSVQIILLYHKIPEFLGAYFRFPNRSERAEQ